MKNLIIIDVETSGLNPDIHEILGIGAVKVATGESFGVKVVPEHIVDADPVALTVNGYTPEGWALAVPLALALSDLDNFMGYEPTMLAHNVSFDRAFLERAYRSRLLIYPFGYHHLDILTLAWNHLPFGAGLSLKKVCEALDITPEPEIHDAETGAQKAFEVYRKLKV